MPQYLMTTNAQRNVSAMIARPKIAAASHSASPIHIAEMNGTTPRVPREMTRATSAAMLGPGDPALTISAPAKMRSAESVMLSPILSRDPIRPRKRHLRHGCRFDGERHQILGLEIVNMTLAAGACNRLGFEGHHLEIVGEPPPRLYGIESLGKLGVLGGDAGRIASLMPVVIGPGRGTELPVFFFMHRVVVAERHQRRRADRYRIGAERQGLADIGAIADAARDDE